MANKLSELCEMLKNPDLHTQCMDLITNYFDDIWELIINKYLRADLVCEEAGLCP
jgi:hypothetical protein